MRSRDGGRTWGEDKVILTFEGENGVNMMCPALLMMQNGDVGLFYLVRLTYARTQIFLRRSSDGGRTWGERVVCTPQEDFFVMNNDRVVRLESGRIIVPVASHRSGEGYMDGRSVAMFFYSGYVELACGQVRVAVFVLLLQRIAGAGCVGAGSGHCLGLGQDGSGAAV